VTTFSMPSNEGRHRRRAGSGSSRRAFTLIEVVVVIGIITLLAALIVTVGPAVVGQSKTRQTEDVLTLLDSAVRQWELETDQKITWGEDGFPSGAIYDVKAQEPANVQLSRVLERLRGTQAAEDVLSRIDPDFLVEVEDTYSIGADGTRLEILDAWENPLVMVHPGRPSNAPVYGDDPMNRDPDGTIYVSTDVVPAPFQYEQALGRCESRRILFVSAGPDGEFGNLNPPLGSDEERQRRFRLTLDNVYSYQIERPTTLEGSGP